VKKKICTVVVALSAALPAAFIATSSAAGAQPPGQCKKINGNCNGQSEEAPPHCAQLPPGQQAKLDCRP
jgi:Spy/CpxP family protein refolding chaperone